MAQTTVARLYDAIGLLPPEHPAFRAAQQSLDSVSLTFRPDPESPAPTYASRLSVITAAPVTARLLELIKTNR